MTIDWTELTESNMQKKKSGSPWQKSDKKGKEFDKQMKDDTTSNAFKLKHSKSVNFDVKKNKVQIVKYNEDDMSYIDEDANEDILDEESPDNRLRSTQTKS